MKQKIKQLQSFFLVLMMLIMGTAGAWADTVVLAADDTNKQSTWTSGNFSVAWTLGGNAEKAYAKINTDGTGVFSTTGSESISSIAISYGTSTTVASMTTVVTINVTSATTATSSDTGAFTATVANNVVTVTAAKNLYVRTTTVTYTTGGGSNYTVTYTAGDGGTCGTSSATYTGSVLTLPSVTPNSSSGNYQNVFNGWYTESSGGNRVGGAGDSYSPTGDIELFAQYSTNYYISTSVVPAGGGAAATIVNKSTSAAISSGTYVPAGTVITVTAGAANSGYAWNRWSVGTNNASLSFDYTVERKKTYTANYTTNTAITPSSAAYTVGDTPSSITYAPTLSPAGDGATYQWYKNSANSAVVDNEHKIDGATSATLAAAKIDTGSEGTTYYYCVVTPTYTNGGAQNGTPATSNIVRVSVVEATPTTYSVTYNGNGNTSGSVPTDDKAYTSGSSVTVKDNSGSLAKTGYNFAGWNTRSDGTGTDYAASGLATFSITANTTLYAKWTAKTYSITLNANGGSANGSATATYNSNKLTGIGAPTYSGKVVEGYYKESACTNKIADASGNLAASTDYTTDGLWKNDGAVILYANWVDASSSYTPFDLSSEDAVIDFSESKWSTSAATALFDAANDGNGANTPINDVVFRGQTSGGKKAFTISDGKLVMDVGNGQSGNRWFAIPLTNINGRIDVYIKTPYAKGTSFSVKAVLAKGTTTVGTSATNLNAVKLDYVDNYFGTGEGAFHFRIKDFTQTTGVLYIGRNGSSWTDINKIKIVSRAAEFDVSATSVTVGDAGTQEVTITNNTVYSARIVDSGLNTAKATYSLNDKTITFTGVSAGDAGSIGVYLDLNNDGEYDSGTEEMKTITVNVNALSWTTNIDTEALRYTTKGATAATLTVAATGATYQWYKNSKNSTSGASAIESETKATYTPSTDFNEDLSYYYCVASKAGYKDIVSNIKPVLTTVSERTFWMNTITRRSTTSESELALTNGTDVNIYGGTATFEGAGSEFNYVYVFNEPYFQVSGSDKYYKIHLNTALTAGMTISIGINGLGSNAGGVWLSQANTRTGASSSKIEFAGDGTETVTTKEYVVQAGDAIVGATDLYVWSKRGSNDYFGPIYISNHVAPLEVADLTPASQIVAQDATATTLSTSVKGGAPTYTYLWQSTSTPDNEGSWVAAAGTNNTATYTPATGSTGTLYYRVKVTDSQATPAVVYSNAVSVKVEANIDYYKIGTGEGQDTGWTDGEYSYYTSETNYGNRGTRTYWTWTKWGGKDTDCYDDYGNLMIKKSSKGVKTTSFNVKGAAAFRIIDFQTKDDRTFDVTVDDTKVGDAIHPTSSVSEAPIYTLNPNGSVITIDNATGDIRPTRIIFYQHIPSTITIKKGDVEISEDKISMDIADNTVFDYDVYTDGDGPIGDTPTVTNPTGLPDGKYVVRNASYADGVLTITKGNYPGTATITLTQVDGTIYKGTTKEFKFTVQKHQIAISVSSPEVTLDLDLDNLSKYATIQAGKLPTFTVTKDGEPWPAGTSVLKYISDDNSVAYLSKLGDFSSTTYDVKYGGGQGGPKIIAYIEESDTYTGDKNSYTLHITQGTDNFISKDMKDETMEAQRVYPMDDANGQTVVKLVYGGYKYNDNRIITIEEGDKDKDDDIVSVKDSWAYYSGAQNAKMDGYTYNMRNGAQNAKSEDKVEILSNPKDARIWYQEGDPKDGGGTYAANERIKPFAMPCAGSYLMFEVKKTGILTAYVLQNGIVGWKKSNDGKIATNPRLGYWFDQDGWVQHPTSVVSKAVISDGNGRDQHNFSGKEYGTDNSLESETFYGDVEGTPSLLYKQLTYKYCDNADKPTKYAQTSGTDGCSAINPYYWPTETSDGDISIDANRAKQVPRKIRPIPYRNGYLMIEEGYLKYTLPVKAGQKYYFLGCGTRIGYVAMNFVENKDAFGADEIDYIEDNVDLKGSDDWTSPTVRTGFTKPTKPTVYSQMTLKRNFTPNQWNTICLPFAVSEKDVEEIFGTGTKLCLYNGLTKKGGNAYVINFMRHVNQDILPGQPYFIYPTGTGVVLGSNGKIGGTTGVEFYDVLVDPDKLVTGINYGSDNDREDGATEKNNEIRYKAVATLAPTYMKQNGFYINTNDGALMKYTPSSDLKVNTYRTFLQPNNCAGTNYSALSLDADLDVEDVSEEGDVPTMIIVVGEDKAEIVNAKLFDGKAYNIMGQEVDAANAKGMVIVNGKKYFRK